MNLSAMEHLKERYTDLSSRYVDQFPKWTNQDFVSLGILLSDIAAAEQQVFESCVKATCAVCNYGSPLGADKKYHIRPYVECAASHLHIRFPEQSTRMCKNAGVTK